MKVIGIHDGHNAAVSLIENGRITFALQEERPSRLKNQHGFPSRALRILYERNGIDANDIDAYLYAGNEQYIPPDNREDYIRAYKNAASVKNLVRRQLRKTRLRNVRQNARREERRNLIIELGVDREKIHFIDHHTCHAYAAYYGSPWRDQDVLVITCDGAGDGLCATVNVPLENGGLERIGHVEEEHSIGILWALITSYLGMLPNEHEYKLMGMAPYADPKRSRHIADMIGSWFILEKNALNGWKRRSEIPDVHYAYNFVRDKFELKRFDDICGGLQLFTEEFIEAWIERLIKETGKSKLALSGGLFMNVKLNKRIMQIPSLKDLFVFPSCGDETNIFGASYAHLAKNGKHESIEPLNGFCLGPTMSDLGGLIDNLRSRSDVIVHEFDNDNRLHNKVADLLAGGEVIARCSGREEFGARALGSRSILARADNPLIVEKINAMVKKRDFWMPFASAILDEDESRYLKNPKSIRAPYMILTFDTTQEAAKDLIAGMHPRDRTLRAQVVDRNLYPDFWNLLKKFKDKTGIGGVLNTSYNLHGYPLVSSSHDAIDVFFKTELKYLVISNVLVEKKARGSLW